MAIENNGINVSYESGDMIREVEEVISEFGGQKLMYAQYKEKSGVMFCVEVSRDKKEGFNVHTATGILQILELQNSII